jgi:hypothetical protein
MPAVYWSLNAGIGLGIGVMLLISNGLSQVLKFVFRSPRPYWYSPQVRALSGEPTFGIPSSHALTSAAVWGLFAALATRRWPKFRWIAWGTAILLAFVIGSSRLFLGVHFPQDVFFGWIAGAMLVWGFLKLEPLVKTRLLEQPFPNQLVIILACSLAMVLLGAVARLSLMGWTIPSEWLKYSALAGPEVAGPNPLELSGTISNAGALLGLAAGALWLRQRGGYDAQGSLLHRLLRYPIGLLGILLIWYGLGAVFPRGELLLPYLLRYLRYTLVGLWISALAPMVFMWSGLAERKAGERRPALVEV